MASARTREIPRPKPAPVRLAARQGPAAGSCDLCGYLPAGPGDRVRHLTREHRRYASGIGLRLAAPVVFAVAVVLLSLARAPQWAYLGALVAAYVLLVAGKVRSGRERSGIGLRPSPSLGDLARRGGVAVLLVVPLLVLVLLAASRL